MKPASSRSVPSRAATLPLLAAGLLLLACRSVEPPRRSCNHEGTLQRVGSSFLATDGCNTCSCESDLTVTCTRMLCLDAGAQPPRGDGGPARPVDGALPTGPEGGPFPDGAAPPPADGAAPPPADGATAGTCLYFGATYSTGQSFTAIDGCNTCTCLSNGGVGCTRKACPPDAAPTTCELADSYEFGDIGGLRIFVDRSLIGPGSRYRRTRTPLVGAGPLLSCAPALPPCSSPGQINAAELQRLLADPDVRAALAENDPPLYGRDNRPVDGLVFELRRADRRGFLAGPACNGQAGCRNVPAGIARLTERLRDLDRQQLAAVECAPLRQP
jgi:hypothetical protein